MHVYITLQVVVMSWYICLPLILRSILMIIAERHSTPWIVGFGHGSLAAWFWDEKSRLSINILWSNWNEQQIGIFDHFLIFKAWFSWISIVRAVFFCDNNHFWWCCTLHSVDTFLEKKKGHYLLSSKSYYQVRVIIYQATNT